MRLGGRAATPAASGGEQREPGVVAAQGAAGGGRRSVMLYVAAVVSYLLLHVQGSSAAVTGLSVTSLEEHQRCYDTVDSLSTELPLEVRAAEREASADGGERRTVSHFYIPYTNNYCKERDERTLELRPDGCLLEPFEPQMFLRMIRGRRLVIWGDSTQRQFFSYFTARLQPYAVNDVEITHKTHYAHLDRGGCEETSRPDKYTGLRLNQPCFEVLFLSRTCLSLQLPVSCWTSQQRLVQECLSPCSVKSCLLHIPL